MPEKITSLRTKAAAAGKISVFSIPTHTEKKDSKKSIRRFSRISETAAIKMFKQVLFTEGLETREYLQAFHLLNQLKALPEKTARILGHAAENIYSKNNLSSLTA